MKRAIELLLLVSLLTACGSSVAPILPPHITPPPTPLPTDTYETPLASYTNVSGCDYGAKPCGSGQNGKTPGYHVGVDYWGNPVGDNEPVQASGPGIVFELQANGKNDHGMGNSVILQHFLPEGGQPIYTLYAHLESINAGVSKGKCVDKGSVIGMMGSSGYGQPKYWGQTPHLHFEFKTKPVLGDPKSDPEKYWGYIPETESDPNPDTWGYLNPNEYIAHKRAIRCEALGTQPLLPIPQSSPAPTRTLAPRTATQALPPRIPVPTPTPPPNAGGKATLGGDGKVYLGVTVLLDPASESAGCFGVAEIGYSPTGEAFLVILECFEGDNEAFLFNANGSGKRRITGAWDKLNYTRYEWAADGHSFEYERINSCCVAAPPGAPAPGIVRYDLATGTKTLVAGLPTPAVRYSVVNVRPDDVLNVRADPGPANPIVGTIPPDGTGIRVTGTGVNVGGDRWVPVEYQGVVGWVNLYYLAISP